MRLIFMAEEASAKKGSLGQGVGGEVSSDSPQPSESSPQSTQPSESSPQSPQPSSQSTTESPNSQESPDSAEPQAQEPAEPQEQSNSPELTAKETANPQEQGGGKLGGNPEESPNETKWETQGETGGEASEPFQPSEGVEQPAEGQPEETLDTIPTEADGETPTEADGETPAEPNPTESLYGGKVTQTLADEISEPTKLPRLSPKQLAEIEVAGDIVVHSNRWKVGDLKRLRVGSLVEFDQKDLTKARLTLEGGLFCEGKLVSRSKHKVALHITKLYQKD